MKKVLVETQIFKPKGLMLTEGKLSNRGNPMVEGILATAEVKNGNGRYYPRELWEREIDKYMESVSQNIALRSVLSSLLEKGQKANYKV